MRAQMELSPPFNLQELSVAFCSAALKQKMTPYVDAVDIFGEL